MALKKIFIGIKIPSDIGALCFQWQSEFKDLPVRWVKAEDLHITLLPPFPLEEEEEKELVKRMAELLKTIQPFSLRFKKIAFGPSSEDPRFVWIHCACPLELLALKRKLDDLLGREEKRKYLPHITLGHLDVEDNLSKRQIEKDLSTFMEVKSVELIESKATEEIKYLILASVPLGKQ